MRFYNSLEEIDNIVFYSNPIHIHVLPIPQVCIQIHKYHKDTHMHSHTVSLYVEFTAVHDILWFISAVQVFVQAVYCG